MKQWWGVLVLCGALGCDGATAYPPDSGAEGGAGGAQAGSGGAGGAVIGGAGAPGTGGVVGAGGAGGAAGAVATAPACPGAFDSSLSCTERAGVPPHDFQCATNCVVGGVAVADCIAAGTTFCIDTCDQCRQ
jgi:hypothetical protein